jgi:hypothetical protein
VNRKEIHQCWVPDGGAWSRWARPVAFAAIPERSNTARTLDPLPDWAQSDIVPRETPSESGDHPYRSSVTDNTAVVVDLKGAASALAGVALAKLKLRPVPLYNAVPHVDFSVSVINMHPILDVLIAGAEAVRDIPLSSAPAFLLDANRMGRGLKVHEGDFDNRSVCTVSDFPSVQTLSNAGIRRVVLIQENDKAAIDLEPILSLWKKHGMDLFLKRPEVVGPPTPFSFTRHSWLQRVAHFVRRDFLPRRDDGAFGAIVSHSSGG